MDSVDDHPDGWGFPIRKSSDQSVLATPRGFSQRATSFIASQCQGIHQMPLLCLISRFVSETDDLAIARISLGSFRAGDDPHPRKRPCYPFLPLCLGDRARNLDFKTSSDKRCQRTNSAPSSGAIRVLCDGGGRRDRTDDLLLAKQALSQLSYAPEILRLRSGPGFGRRDAASSAGARRPAPLQGSSRSRDLVGQGGFEPPTSRLSSARSNQLSY